MFVKQNVSNTHLCLEVIDIMAGSGSKTPGMRRQPRQARSQERVNQILDVAEVGIRELIAAQKSVLGQ